MKLTRYVVPFDCTEVLELWGNVFGAAEAALEKPQIDGSEATENLDIVYTAAEGDTLLGTVHATIPKHAPTLCGLSGMCTVPQSRGKGLGRLLFATILEEIDRLGVETTFLGTSNPVAAKLYHSLGFSFLPGSNVMVRHTHDDTVDFTKRTYAPIPEAVRIVSGSPAMRIPLIPLVLHRGSQKLLDCNTGLLNSSLATQVSCMGLYPRYDALRKQGGNLWGAVSETGVLGAVASAVKTELGVRADFFCCDSFLAGIPCLLDACSQTFGELYLHLAEMDTAKRSLAESLGFRTKEALSLQAGAFTFPGLIYTR